MEHVRPADYVTISRQPLLLGLAAIVGGAAFFIAAFVGIYKDAEGLKEDLKLTTDLQRIHGLELIKLRELMLSHGLVLHDPPTGLIEGIEP